MIKKVRNKLIFSLLTAFALFMTLGALAFGGVTNVARADEIVSEFQMLNGASVRYIAPTGIRFTSRMPADDYDTLKTNHSDAEIATLLLPTHMLGENTLTVDNYKTLGAVKAEFTERYVVDGYATFNAVLTGLGSSFYDTDLTAVSYVKVGESVQYAQYTEDERVKTSVSRNIADVSAVALASGKYNNNEAAYLFLTDMVFTNYTVESNMGPNETSETNVGVALDTAFTKAKNESVVAVSDGVISNVTYTATDGGEIVEKNGTQYFYAPDAGKYTVTSTATIKQGGNTTDITSNKTITVSAPAAQDIGWVYNYTNSEIKFYLKMLPDENIGSTYVLNLPDLGNLMTITRTSENKGTISLLHSSSMVDGKRYAEKSSELDFGSGVYVKVIKYATADSTAVTTVYTSAKGESYSLYAAAFYSSIYDFNFNRQSLASASYNTILLTANTPVFVSNFSTTTPTEPTETKITSLPKFEQFEVDLAASASKIRVGGNSNLTLTATYDDADVTALSTVNYTIKKGGEITEDATITDGKFTTDVAGTYTVTATATYAGKEKTASVTITVLDNELSATLTFTPSPVEANKDATASLSVIYNDEEVVSGYTVVYSIISDNAANARITDGVFTADENGTYTVRAAVSYNGLNCNADRNITVAASHTVVIDLSDTSSVSRTNVGVFLYDKVTVDGDVTVKYPVSWTTSGGTIATYNGESYFYATSAGDYTLTAKITVDDVDYEQTKTITVSDSTAVANIYNSGIYPYYTREEMYSEDDDIIVGLDGYYYGKDGEVENGVARFTSLAGTGNFALDIYVKFLNETTGHGNTVFFTTTIGGTESDIIKINRSSSNATLTLDGNTGSSISFTNGVYLRFYRVIGASSTTVYLYTSTNGTEYSVYLTKTYTSDDIRDGSFTKFIIFSQTPLMLAKYNFIGDVSFSADMSETASSAYTDQTVTLNTAVSFGGNSLDSGYTLAYEITAGDCATLDDNGVLTPSAAGSITVRATATYNGFTATTSKTITFNAHTLTAAVSASKTNVETREKITLTAAATYDGNPLDSGYTVVYSISPKVGASIEDGKFTATTEGTYTVTLTVSYNNKEATDTVVINVGHVIAGSISLSDTTDVSRTNVGVVIYADVTFTVDGVASDAYTVEYNATGGNIGTIDGKPYFVATSAGNYTITATLKYNGVAVENATDSIEIDVADGTALSAIYSCNSTGDLGSGSIEYSDIVIGREGCYNGRSGDIKNKCVSYLDVYVDFGSNNPISNIEYTIFVKFLPEQVNNGDDIYFNLIFDKNRGGTMTHTIMKINTNGKIQLAKVVNNVLTYQPCEENINFANGIYVKFSYNAVMNSAGTFKVEISDDNVSYRDCVSTSISKWGFVDYGLDGINIYANTPVIIGNYTVKNTSHF